MRCLRWPVVVVLALAGCSFNPSGRPGAIDAAPGDGPDDAAGPDACGTAELCNGADDDCDGNVDEGFGVGQACDGADTDMCEDDVTVCTADGMGTTCAGPDPDDDVELCDGLDNDCDGTADNGFELGVACDGAGDGDLCAEGVWACDPVSLDRVCTDMTSTTVELCGGGDEDCDPTTIFDTTGDVANCGACGRVCAATNATAACVASTCAPVCTPGANDCDGNPDNGCELRDTDPSCAGSPSLGAVDGDQASPPLTTSGYGEAYYAVTINEALRGAGSVIPLSATVTLTSPAGTNFDLDVTCNACGGSSQSSSTTGVDSVGITRADITGDNSYTIGIHVRWTSSTACGNWTLLVEGEAAAGLVSLTCP